RRERVQRQIAQAHRVGGAHQPASRLHALAMAGDARQALARCPPPVAVHADRHVGRHRLRADHGEQLLLADAVEAGSPRRRAPYNERIFSSFFFSSSSAFVTNSSVVFCTWSCAWRCSSSEACVFFAAALSLSFASRRTLRTAPRASSAILATVFTSCLR